MWFDGREIIIRLVEYFEVGLVKDACLVEYEDGEQLEHTEGHFDPKYPPEVEHLVYNLHDDWIKDDSVTS